MAYATRLMLGRPGIASLIVGAGVLLFQVPIVGSLDGFCRVNFT